MGQPCARSSWHTPALGSQGLPGAPVASPRLLAQHSRPRPTPMLSLRDPENRVMTEPCSPGSQEALEPGFWEGERLLRPLPRKDGMSQGGSRGKSAEQG